MVPRYEFLLDDWTDDLDLGERSAPFARPEGEREDGTVVAIATNSAVIERTRLNGRLYGGVGINKVDPKERGTKELSPEKARIIDRTEGVVCCCDLNFSVAVEKYRRGEREDFVGGIQNSDVLQGTNSAQVADMNGGLRSSRYLNESRENWESGGVKAGGSCEANRDFSRPAGS
jgi:DNA-binding transcriptional regulator YdaS (Cro superfamily)